MRAANLSILDGILSRFSSNNTTAVKGECFVSRVEVIFWFVSTPGYAFGQIMSNVCETVIKGLSHFRGRINFAFTSYDFSNAPLYVLARAQFIN